MTPSAENTKVTPAERPDRAIPQFRTGDRVRVHAKVIEGSKERIQVFEGVVIRRHKRNHSNATFTVRKVSYNVGVERTFLLRSPRIDRIELVGKGRVRRARLFYLRHVRGKSGKIRTQLEIPGQASNVDSALSQNGSDIQPTSNPDAATEVTS